MPSVDQDGNVLLSAAAPIESLHGEAFAYLRFELLQQRSHSGSLRDLKVPLTDKLA
jgi:hypothetical protein